MLAINVISDNAPPISSSFQNKSTFPFLGEITPTTLLCISSKSPPSVATRSPMRADSMSMPSNFSVFVEARAIASDLPMVPPASIYACTLFIQSEH